MATKANIATQTYNDTQVMMTLAALAHLDETRLPLESVSQQEQRILKAINEALSNQGIATGGNWKAIWIGLSEDRANMSYIAQNSAANQHAIVFRGTDFLMGVDIKEDFEVGTAVPFLVTFPVPIVPVIIPVMVSQGSMDAFNEITSAVYTDGTTLFDAVGNIAKASPDTTLYITGHSLGGAIASMVSMALLSESSPWGALNLQVYTFAAPTAGLNDFAGLFDKLFPTNSWRVYNLWDAVPNAWQTLSNIDNFYPGGPVATDDVKKIIADLQSSTNGLQYTQPTVNPVPLNQGEIRDPQYINNTLFDFLMQVGYQHDGNTYLTLLGAPPIPSQA